MNLTYAGIKLQICHFETLQMRAVLSEDGASRIGTHWRIAVVSVWNPLATASFGGGVATPPGGVAGDGPALSLATLKGTLLQPRQQLLVDIGGTVIVESPPSYAVGLLTTPVDAANGPTPISCTVVGGFHGIQTAIVRFEIETTLADPPVSPAVVLSNRWDSTEDIDDTFRSTIHVEGTAVFASDALWIVGHRPDAFRQQFILPVPMGYQRTNLRVRASSDGLRVSYSFDDEQAEGGYQLLPGSPIVRIRGTSWVDNNWPLPGATLIPTPTVEIGIRVEVKGRQTSTRSQLANACVRAISSSPLMAGKNVNIARVVGHTYRLEVDFPARSARASLVGLSNGILGGAINALASQNLQEAANTALFNDYSAAGLWTYGGAAATNVGPSSGGTRSDAVIALITQSLLAPNEVPSLPAPLIYTW